MAKRFLMDMPDELYEELEVSAEARGITTSMLVRKFIGLGLLALQVAKTDGQTIVFRVGDSDRELTL